MAIKNQTTNKNICSVCHRPYDYKLRIVYNPDGTKVCFHDGEAGSFLHFDLTDQRMIKKLPKGKVLVKSSDGVSRICEIVKDKYGRPIKRKK